MAEDFKCPYMEVSLVVQDELQSCLRDSVIYTLWKDKRIAAMIRDKTRVIQKRRNEEQVLAYKLN
jgi:hypothetical protein